MEQIPEFFFNYSKLNNDSSPAYCRINNLASTLELIWFSRFHSYDFQFGFAMKLRLWVLGEESQHFINAGFVFIILLGFFFIFFQNDKEELAYFERELLGFIFRFCFSCNSSHMSNASSKELAFCKCEHTYLKIQHKNYRSCRNLFFIITI